MRVGHITNPDAEVLERCPEANTTGLFMPNQDQLELLISRDGSGGLNPSLTNESLVQWGDAVATLGSAAVFRLLESGGATASSGFGGAGNPVVANAIADLAVTGILNSTAFRIAAGEGGSVDIAALRARIAEGVPAAADRLGVHLIAGREADIHLAVNHVVDRALSVLWALHGPVEHRRTARAPLGWIAVNAERDPPPRPVNVGGIDWPCADLNLVVDHDGRAIRTRIRYAISGAIDADSHLSVFDSLPRVQRPPIIPDDCLILVFLHGHSSRLEEAGCFHQGLIDEQDFSAFSRPFAVISFDFPSNGYSEYRDHEDISPFGTTTRFVPDHPEERRFGMLEYYEKLTIAFVEELDRQLVADGREGILSRIAAVVGGSMGGNLALRLSERLVTDASWLDALVSWSPASVYVSFGRSDYFIPSPGEHFDPIAKEALERPQQRCQHAETDSSRAEFIGLQMQGERLINDGTPEFEAGVRLLGFFLQPLVAGLAPVILGPALGPLVSGFLGPVVFGSVTIEGVANISTIKQSDEWLREGCRAEFDSAAASQQSLMYLNEIYNSIRRRTHWRIAYEQLLFSHQDEIAASRGLPCYQASTLPTLLIAGANDVVDEHRFNIFGGVRHIAPLMINNPGLTQLVEETGHSIHAERPRWLARKIFGFIRDRRPPIDVVGVSRDGSRITHFHFGKFWKPIPYERMLSDALAGNGTTFYFVTDAAGNRTQIIARRFLATPADGIDRNNLRALPRTSQPEPEGLVEGPAGGFQITQVRVKGPAMSPRSWISHFCNDELGVQVSCSHAERAVRNHSARYFIVFEGEEIELILREFLTTSPDDSVENNLVNLPEVEA